MGALSGTEYLKRTSAQNNRIYNIKLSFKPPPMISYCRLNHTSASRWQKQHFNVVLHVVSSGHLIHQRYWKCKNRVEHFQNFGAHYVPKYTSDCRSFFGRLETNGPITLRDPVLNPECSGVIVGACEAKRSRSLKRRSQQKSCSKCHSGRGITPTTPLMRTASTEKQTNIRLVLVRASMLQTNQLV